MLLFLPFCLFVFCLLYVFKFLQPAQGMGLQAGLSLQFINAGTQNDCQMAQMEIIATHGKD